MNDMLLICRYLLKHQMKIEIQEFIFNCPEEFLYTYSNNSERKGIIFYELRKLGLKNLCDYLLPYVDI